MAILNEDEDEFKNVERSIAGGTSYVGGGYAGGGQNQAPQQSGPKNEKGTGFVNIEDYLSGGTGKAAEKIAFNTDVQGNLAARNIGDYNTEVDKSTNVKDFDPKTAGNWLYDVSTYATKPGQKAEFKQNVPSMMQTVKPTGFSDVAGYSPAQSGVAKVSDRIKQSGTQEGLQGQMKELVSPGMNYTTGMNRWDALGAQVGPGAQAIKNSQQKWGGINNWLTSAEQGAQGKIEGAREKAKTVNAQWQRAGELAQQKANETNTYLDSLATSKQNKAQNIAANQPGPGAGNYVTPAQQPKSDATQQPKIRPNYASKEENLVLDYLVPKMDLVNPVPKGLDSKFNPLRGASNTTNKALSYLPAPGGAKWRIG